MVTWEGPPRQTLQGDDTEGGIFHTYVHVYVVWEEEAVGKTLQQQVGVVRNITVDTLQATSYAHVVYMHM